MKTSRYSVTRCSVPILAAAILCASVATGAQTPGEAPLSSFRSGTQMRWFSFENQNGEKGRGGTENRGAKGHAFDTLAAGGSVVLAHMDGAGTVRRIWMTMDDRSAERRRNLWVEMYWDGARTPAVSVPLGDFFGEGEGPMTAMQNALFASPEGRSFESFVPMPFRKSARIVLVNKGSQDLTALYYDVDITREAAQPADALYFHAYWHRENPTRLGHAFRILPRIEGKGRYLGSYVSLVTDPSYGDTWFGEGEFKVYLDGDQDHPTLVGTGTEDLIGDGYDQGAFVNQFTGAPVADPKTRQWTFYRFHVPDPIFFSHDIAVDLQQIGGAGRQQFLQMQAAGVRMEPVTVDAGGRAGFHKLLESAQPMKVGDPAMPDGWVNFYRQDDVAAVAYFYLDRPDGITPDPE